MFSTFGYGAKAKFPFWRYFLWIVRAVETSRLLATSSRGPGRKPGASLHTRNMLSALLATYRDAFSTLVPLFECYPMTWRAMSAWPTFCQVIDTPVALSSLDTRFVPISRDLQHCII